MLPVSYAKTTFNPVNGKLILTDQRLVFAGGRFQSPIQALAGGHADHIEIPLTSITSVEKGLMATVKVQAGREYVFKGMSGAGDWVTAILSASQQASAAPPPPPPPPPQQQYAPPPQQQYAPPPQQQPPQNAPPAAPPAAAPGGKFCTGCGTPAGPSDRFCGGCGAAV